MRNAERQVDKIEGEGEGRGNVRERQRLLPLRCGRYNARCGCGGMGAEVHVT
jgi:hypothetical protein